jgi:hypothetical protein
MLIASSSPLDEAPDCWLLEEAQWHRSWIITTDRRLRERYGRRHECRDHQKTREDETKSYEINSQISLSLSLSLSLTLSNHRSQKHSWSEFFRETLNHYRRQQPTPPKNCFIDKNTTFRQDCEQQGM